MLLLVDIYWKFNSERAEEISPRACWYCKINLSVVFLVYESNGVKYEISLLVLTAVSPLTTKIYTPYYVKASEDSMTQDKDRKN